VYIFAPFFLGVNEHYFSIKYTISHFPKNGKKNADKVEQIFVFYGELEYNKKNILFHFIITRNVQKNLPSMEPTLQTAPLYQYYYLMWTSFSVGKSGRNRNLYHRTNRTGC
jgi:hypothetical protein